MSAVTFGPFEVDWDLQYPNIDITGYVNIPKSIPIVGGQHKIGSTTLNLDHLSETIKIGITGLSASMTVTLEPAECEVEISAEATAGLWHIKKATSFQYMKPFRLKVPAWDGDTVNESNWNSALNSGDPKQMPNGPTNIQDSDGTRAALKALFIFAGAPTFIDDSISAAQRISAALEKASAPAGQATRTRPSPAALFAIGPDFTQGFGIGLSAGGGIYFSSSGGFGAFGSLGIDLGLIAEITASCAVYVFWSDYFLLAGDKTDLQNFSGDNWAINIGGDLDVIPVTVSFAEFWPLNPFESGGMGVGVSASIGVGIGVPLEFYVSNTYTWTRPFGGAKAKAVSK